MGAIRKFKRKKDINRISLETVNKQIYDQLPPLTEDQINEIKPKLEKWFYQIGYAMLLSNENRDYTVFINHDQDTKEAINALLECLNNRGTIHDIDYVEDDDSWEIWLKINKKMFYYKLFNYAFGIIRY